MQEFLSTTLAGEPFASFQRAWEAVRTQGDLPSRQDIHLRNFVDHLDNLVIYERRGRRDLRYRLTGSGVAERVDNLGIEVNLFDHFVPEVHEACEEWWNAVMDKPCGGLMEFSTRFSNGTTRAGIALALPIISERGETLLLARNHMMDIIDLGEPCAAPQFGEKYAVGHYFDIGFGLPDGKQTLVAKEKSGVVAQDTDHKTA